MESRKEKVPFRYNREDGWKLEEDRKRGRNKAERTAGTRPQKPDSATIFGGTSSLQKIWVVC